MKKEDLEKLGLTEEQISSILDINKSDLEEAKKKNIDPKLLKQLQEDSAAYKKLQEADLTDAEKIQKALDDAAASKSEFAKKSNRLDVEKILVGAGLTEEDYKDLIDGLVTEDADASKALATNLANMLTKQKEAAVQKTKEELMDGTQTPGGKGGSGGNEGNKTDAEKLAETMVKENASDTKGTEAIIDAYK